MLLELRSVMICVSYQIRPAEGLADYSAAGIAYFAANTCLEFFFIAFAGTATYFKMILLQL